ncbi:GntR family transcriptional regulator, partial [Rhizobium ruizarguesonis]
LRPMTIKTERRGIEGPLQMSKIVDAIRRGDDEGAYRAAMAHVAAASAIAESVLSGKTPSA